MTKLQELKDLSTDELLVRERDLVDEVFRLRLKRASGQLREPHGAAGGAPDAGPCEDAAA